MLLFACSKVMQWARLDCLPGTVLRFDTLGVDNISTHSKVTGMSDITLEVIQKSIQSTSLLWWMATVLVKKQQKSIDVTEHILASSWKWMRKFCFFATAVWEDMNSLLARIKGQWHAEKVQQECSDELNLALGECVHNAIQYIVEKNNRCMPNASD